MIDRVLTLQEAAHSTGVSVATLRRLIDRGEGPSVAQLSIRRVGIRESQLMAWIQDCERVREDHAA